MKHSWTPNKWQSAVLRTYGDGDYSWIVDGHEASFPGESDSEPPRTFKDADAFDEWCVEHLGDTLLLFLMRELADSEDVGDGAEALRRVQCAIEDLQNVLAAVALV